jgi:hypothetical protein
VCSYFVRNYFVRSYFFVAILYVALLSVFCFNFCFGLKQCSICKNGALKYWRFLTTDFSQLAAWIVISSNSNNCLSEYKYFTILVYQYCMKAEKCAWWQHDRQPEDTKNEIHNEGAMTKCNSTTHPSGVAISQQTAWSFQCNHTKRKRNRKKRRQ